MAERVRTASARLTSVGALEWQGSSAERFRERLTELCRGASTFANRCEDAATLVRVHESAVAAMAVAP
ncbi:MAG: hypothetical protein ACRYF3_05375 [Janthinobacterium lividum]